MICFVYNHIVLVVILQQVTAAASPHTCKLQSGHEGYCDKLSGVLFSFSSVKTQNQTCNRLVVSTQVRTCANTHTHTDVLPQLRAEYLLKRMFDRHPLGTRLKKSMQQNHEQLTDTGQLGEMGSGAERYCTFYENHQHWSID